MRLFFTERSFEGENIKTGFRLHLHTKKFALFETMATANVTVVETVVHPGQKPGTSGLRKKVEEFMQEHYMENFIQCKLELLS